MPTASSVEQVVCIRHTVHWTVLKSFQQDHSLKAPRTHFAWRGWCSCNAKESSFSQETSLGWSGTAQRKLEKARHLQIQPVLMQITSSKLLITQSDTIRIIRNTEAVWFEEFNLDYYHSATGKTTSLVVLGLKVYSIESSLVDSLCCISRLLG